MSQATFQAKDLAATSRAKDFEANAALVCHLQIVHGDETFALPSALALPSDQILSDNRPTDCCTQIVLVKASANDDNFLLYLAPSKDFKLRRKDTERPALSPNTPADVPGDITQRASFPHPDSRAFYLRIPSLHLAPCAIPHLGDELTMTPQWRLVLAYLRGLWDESASLSQEDLQICARHLGDLVLRAFAAAADRSLMKPGTFKRGLAARLARLNVICDDIELNLTHPDLSPGWIAARHKISKRYLRALFADQGRNFSDHVVLQRLLRVQRQLTDPTQKAVSISQIAFDAGFGDISAFYQRFRQTFDMAPGEMRARALAAYHSKNTSV